VPSSHDQLDRYEQLLGTQIWVHKAVGYKALIFSQNARAMTRSRAHLSEPARLLERKTFYRCASKFLPRKVFRLLISEVFTASKSPTALRAADQKLIVSD